MPTITNQLNLWDENGTTASGSTVESSTSLANNSKRQGGFVQNDSLPSKTFNGILKEMSLVTKAFVTSLNSINNTSSADDLTVNNETSVSTLAATIASIFNNINISSATSATTAGTATNLAGTTIGSIPYQSASATTGYIAPGQNGKYLKMVSGLPQWADAPSGGGGGSADTATYAYNLKSASADTYGLAYQTGVDGTAFVQSTALNAGGVLMSSGTSGAPVYTKTLGLFTYSNDSFYSGSHSSESDANTGTLLTATGAHIQGSSAKVKVINGSAYGQVGAGYFTADNGGTGTSYSYNTITSSAGLTIDSSSGTTINIGSVASVHLGATSVNSLSVNAVSKFNATGIIYNSTTGVSGNAGDIIFVRS